MRERWFKFLAIWGLVFLKLKGQTYFTLTFKFETVALGGKVLPINSSHNPGVLERDTILTEHMDRSPVEIATL